MTTKIPSWAVPTLLASILARLGLDDMRVRSEIVHAYEFGLTVEDLMVAVGKPELSADVLRWLDIAAHRDDGETRLVRARELARP